MFKIINNYKSHYISILKLGIPVILAQLGQITVGLIDNMMIGMVGTQELAAASFANTIFSLVIIFGMGFSFVLTPLVSQARGNFNIVGVGAWFYNGMVSMFGMGLLLCGFLVIAICFMDKMGQPQEIVVAAQQYLGILTVSVPFMMIFFGFKQFSEGVANTKVAMYIMLMANIVNIIGNYLFIYGKFGCPSIGLNGAGVGSLLARIFMAVVFYLVMIKGRSFQRYRASISRAKLRWKNIRRIWGMGLPIGAQLVMEASAFMLSTIMMGWISVEGLAAHQIALSISTLSFMLYQGIAASTTICISSLYGQKNWVEIKDTGWAAIHLVLAMVVVLSTLFLTLRNVLPSLFSKEPAVIGLTAQFIVVMVIYQFFDALQIVFGSILRGLSDVNIPSLMTFVAYFLVSLPTSYLCAFCLGMGEVGIWWGLPVGLATAAMLFMLRFKSLVNRFLQ